MLNFSMFLSTESKRGNQLELSSTVNLTPPKLKCRRGFTLAEILITLTVIGVVAALTIPTLLQNTNQAELKTAWKRAYANANQAWKMVVAEKPYTYTARGGWTCTYPTGETADYSFADGRIDAFKSKLNVIKNCVNQDGCWASSYENYNDTLIGWSAGNCTPKKYSWITADGMCWAAPFYGLDETHILVDTNCGKPPNKIGQDIFSLFLGADGDVYFAIGDKSTNGKPVSSGGVCPYAEAPVTINGRSVDFADGLKN